MAIIIESNKFSTNINCLLIMSLHFLNIVWLYLEEHLFPHYTDKLHYTLQIHKFIIHKFSKIYNNNCNLKFNLIDYSRQFESWKFHC